MSKFIKVKGAYKMSEDCVFCKMVRGEIPVNKVYEDDDVFAFTDIDPQSPVHILVIPKKHMESLACINEDDVKLLGRIQLAISKIAKMYPESKNGFRVVANAGADAGQTVFHLHYHLLCGRKFTWPPG
jgi:histidine triad (HIT) family protein